MTGRLGRRLALTAAAIAAGVLSGCSDDEGRPAAGAGAEPGMGGALVWTVGGEAGRIDPLRAATPAERLAARQIFEPLVDGLTGPFGDTRELSGLALRVRPGRDPTIWRLDLRQGVRFQDGARFNASAVLANVARWRATAVAQRLLPDGFAVDAPRPHLVRFILPAPDPGLDRRLASPRLGIVSPRALGPDPAALGGEPLGEEDAGTGAFQLREHEPDRLLLAHNPAWWGAERGLGPALERVEVLLRPDATERVDLLVEGAAQVADRIGPRGRRTIEADPLLTALPQGGETWRGVERSVRGIDSGRGIPSLHRVWLTKLGG